MKIKIQWNLIITNLEIRNNFDLRPLGDNVMEVSVEKLHYNEVFVHNEVKCAYQDTS